jgi:hypothetical protein
MTAAGAQAPSRQLRASRLPIRVPGRLLRLELRRSDIVWTLPLLALLLWFTSSTHQGGVGPWNLRGIRLHQALLGVMPFAAGMAAWTGSRDGRRGTIDLVAVAALPRWAGRLTTWAATTCWAVAAYLVYAGALYWETEKESAWAGSFWWPVAVGAVATVAACALGFVAGAFFPGRFTAALAAVGVFLAITVGMLAGQHSYGLISPEKSGALNTGIFYPYLPDVAITQLIFLAGLAAAALGALGLSAASGGPWLRRTAAAVTAAGLLAAGTGVGLVGTGHLRINGVVIPAVHDAANDRPLRYTPACSHSVIPICVHPAYRNYLPTVTTAVAPVLSQVVGLPGAPVRVTQAATPASLGTSASTTFSQSPSISGNPPVLQVRLIGPATATGGLIDLVRLEAAIAIVDAVIGVGQHGGVAQQAIAVALLKAVGAPLIDEAAPRGTPSPPVYAAALRFAALPAATRHAWLATHEAALRAGRITLKELP